VNPWSVVVAVVFGVAATLLAVAELVPGNALNAGATVTIAALFLRYLRRRDDSLQDTLKEVNKALGAVTAALQERER